MDIQENIPTEIYNDENSSIIEDSTILNISEKRQKYQKIRCNKYFSTSKSLIEKLRKGRNNQNIKNKQKEEKLQQTQQIDATSQGEANQNSALCINCYELINENFYDLHSKICQNISQALETLEESSYISKIDFKITKIVNFLQKESLNQIMQLALNILQISYQDLACHQTIKSNTQELQLLKVQVSFLEQTYIDRLIFLARVSCQCRKK